jgi:Asp-tRNA(Asn)/Glu-tRNA(Gln) amidotransferase A subunit family amidase
MDSWRDRLSGIVAEGVYVISPALESLAPTIAEYRAGKADLARFTSPVNLAGLPAIVFPIPSGGFMPASLQIIGAHGSEWDLVDLAEEVHCRAWERW